MKRICHFLFTVLLLGFCATCGFAQLSTEDMVAYAKPAVVFIRHRDATGQQYTGSGFLVHQNGDVLTCAHVVQPKPTKGSRVSDKIWVRLYDGTVHEASVARCDTESDIALLDISVRGYPFLNLETSAPAQGEDVTVIGFPLGELLGKEPTVTKGVVSALRFSDTAYQLGAAVNPGNSGGPALNKNGDVLGIVSFKVRDAEGICFAIASSTFGYSLSKMIDGKAYVTKDGHYVPKEWLTSPNELERWTIEDYRSEHICHNTRSPLHRAADAGDLVQVKAALSKGLGVDIQDAQGQTPLHLACNLPSAKWLNMNASEYQDYIHRKLEVATLLINRGADANAPDENVITPLYRAAGCKESSEHVRLLLEHGGDVKAANSPVFPVWYQPILLSNSETMRLLLQHGMDVNCEDKAGRTPLRVALDSLTVGSTEDYRTKLMAVIDVIREFGGKE